MCNWIHKNIESIKFKENGNGWKLFRYGYPKLLPLCYGNYRKRKDGWIEWDKEDQIGDGFCFFYTRKEAQRALRDWKEKATLSKNSVLRKIQYRNSVAKQKEDNFITGIIYEIGICKEFKIL